MDALAKERGGRGWTAGRLAAGLDYQAVDDGREALVQYLKMIDAPGKEMVRLQGGGHFAVWSRADKFREKLIRRVRPRAKKP